MDKQDYSTVGKQDIAVAAAKAEVANNAYNDYVNEVIENDDEWNTELLRYLREQANEADTAYLMAREQAERRHWSDDPRHWGGMNDD